MPNYGKQPGSINMKNFDDKKDDMYGVSRFDDAKRHTHGWRVSLRRRGKRLVENFPDKKFGGRQKALKLAQQFRDELICKFPPISRKEVCLIRRSNNSSGITGVCTYAKRYKLRDGSYKETKYWEASWPGEQGKKVSINFSVRKYGNEMARSMAIRARQRALENIEGVFWVSQRGVVEKNNIDRTYNNLNNSSKRVA